MCIESKYLVNKFLELKNNYRFPDDDILFSFKNFYVYTDNELKRHCCWFEEDVQPNINYIKNTIIGIGYFSFPTWLRLDGMFSVHFNYAWNQIGSFFIPIKNLLHESYDAFMKSIYAQILMYVDKGNDIYVGTNLLFAKKSTYKILIETELAA